MNLRQILNLKIVMVSSMRPLKTKKNTILYYGK
jgi:hypothetical protein